MLETESLTRALFVSRLNRFVVRFRRGTRFGRAYLANPGRLGEVLLPGTELLLARRRHPKLGWEALGATWSQRWPRDRPRTVFLAASRVNQLAERLLAEQRIPELRGYRIERKEFTCGHSRFDFLLTSACGRYLLEVKSVTLVEQGLALFPDAQTERGRRHLEHLAELSRQQGWRAGVLFLVQGHAERFLPDFHNDLEFARTFGLVRQRVEFLPYCLNPSLEPTGRMAFAGAPRPLTIPWRLLDVTLEDSGLYLLAIHLPRAMRLRVGALGVVDLAAGYYVYTGSAKRGLTARLSRHMRPRKRRHYHVDYLRARSAALRAFPIRGASRECDLAWEVGRIASATVQRFGSSDCGCLGHLAYFREDPVHTAPFQELLTRMRHQPWGR
jgi:sugar fermentation stimulation protein A